VPAGRDPPLITAAYLSVTVAIQLVILLVWRKRADAVAALARAHADARRGRHAQALGADMANIAQALVLSLETIDRSDLSKTSVEAVAEARASMGSFIATMRAAQHLVDGQPRPIEANAEGWVRVAVAGARAEGVGVRLGGICTPLRVHGRSADIARVLEGLIIGLGATVPLGGFVQVDLAPAGVDLSAPIAAGGRADERIARAAAIAGLAGCTAMVVTESQATIVRLRGATGAEDDSGGR
jgi:hypothetical protein